MDDYINGSMQYGDVIYGGTCAYLGHQMFQRKWLGTLEVVPSAEFLCSEPPGSDGVTQDLPSGGKYNKHTGVGVTWYQAATVKGVAGFDAHSGFSDAIDSYYQAGTNQNVHYICGNGVDMADTNRVFAGQGW